GAPELTPRAGLVAVVRRVGSPFAARLGGVALDESWGETAQLWVEPTAGVGDVLEDGGEWPVGPGRDLSDRLYQPRPIPSLQRTTHPAQDTSILAEPRRLNHRADFPHTHRHHRHGADLLPGPRHALYGPVPLLHHLIGGVCAPNAAAALVGPAGGIAL